MQLKVKVISKGQGHVHFTTEQDTLLHWYCVQWMYGHILLLMAQYILYRTEVKVTKAVKLKNLTQLKKKNRPVFRNWWMSIYFTGLFISVIIFYIYWFVHTMFSHNLNWWACMNSWYEYYTIPQLPPNPADVCSSSSSCSRSSFSSSFPYIYMICKAKLGEWEARPWLEACLTCTSGRF